MLVLFRKVVDPDTDCAYSTSKNESSDDFTSRFDEMKDPGVESRATVVLLVLLMLMLMLASLMGLLVLKSVVVLLFGRLLILVQGDDATDCG
jgi:hypothetical protein